MADIYTYWREELVNAGCNDRDTDRRDIAGFYRIKGADTKPDYPVAIWLVGEKLVAKIGRKNDLLTEGSENWYDFLGSSWLKCSAVTHEAYTAAIEAGRWPDDDKPARKMDAAEWHGVKTGTIRHKHTNINSGGAAPAGHNLPDDPCESLKIELEGEREQAEAMLRQPITTQEQADTAAAWAKKFTEIAKKADNYRKVEKQPHMDAAGAVDAKWRPIVDDGKDLSTRLKRHLDGWLREQARIEEERQKKAREEAEKARLAAEEAARAAAQASEDDETAKAAAREAEEAAKQAERETQARNAQAGRTGAKVAMREFTSGEITDYDTLLMALKDRDEIKEVVQSLANRAARSGVELPGMRIVKERRAA